MASLKAFLQLVRWKNMVFIALAQALFFYAIISPIITNGGHRPNLSGYHLIVLAIASVCIAAAGNIINDYFDYNIDLVNKPDKVVVGRVFAKGQTILLHLFMSAVGVGLSFYLDYVSGVAFLGPVNLVCVVLLFLYSMSLKKKLLLGNVLVSALTAWSIAVVTYAESSVLLRQLSTGEISSINKMTFLYAGFAFMVSLIREAVKDLEDMAGDERYGCTTMPLVWGVNATKMYVAVWLFVLMGVLLLLQIYVLNFGWWPSTIYSIVFLIIPAGKALQTLRLANTPLDYHALSSRIKFIMLMGILSMAVLRWVNPLVGG